MKKLIIFLLAITLLIPSSFTLAQVEFNPNFIISDEQLQSLDGWTSHDIQAFLVSRNSYLSKYMGEDVDGNMKSAADIIYDASVRYNINPKFLLVTLQKEQSLVTTLNPTQRQIDWATGFAVCDGCSLNDPKVLKFKGFGKQVSGSAAIMRWYYDNKNNQSFIKKAGETININNQPVTPQNWATAFMYTYTPHLHGNMNFWRIWNNWFAQFYPNGTIITNAENSDYWVVMDGKKRRFKTTTALITRADPNTAVMMADADIRNYQDGSEISLPNYSILKAPSGYYLIDYNFIRPFASESVVRALGYNPQEIIEVNNNDLHGYVLGPTIQSGNTAPQGEIYKISDIGDALYLHKDGVLHPIIDSGIIKANFSNLDIITKQKKDIAGLKIASEPTRFADGTLIQIKENNRLFVIDNGKKRRISDEASFLSMGYKKENLVSISFVSSLGIPEGEAIYVSNSLASTQPPSTPKIATKTPVKGPIADSFKSSLPAYLVAEYPSGNILAGKNIDEKRSAASIVKVMVAYEALNQNLDLNKATTYNPSAHATVYDRLKLSSGEKVSNKDLLYSFLIGPINNAARMIAQATGLSEPRFITAMNSRTNDWGAKNTKIVDTTGLSANNISSAKDMMTIFNKAVSNKIILESMGRTSHSFTELLTKDSIANHKFTNFNELMFDLKKNYEILASNTGYTRQSGAIMMALIECKKTKKQFTIITMGDSDYENRFKEPHRLAEWAISANASAGAVAGSN